MKNKGIFPGLLLIGIGFYFLMHQLHIPTLEKIFTWPTLLIILGIIFLLQAYFSNDHDSIFPGTILLGIGTHIHGKSLFAIWPNHWGMYTLIISLAFLLRYQKTKTGLVPGIILLVISILGVFYGGLISWMSWIGKFVSLLESFWPVALIAIGLYLLFVKKK